MGREFHVRFCEGLGVKFPRATRLVIGFENEADAQRVMEVLPKRFGKYGLTIHPEKTRLVPFQRPQSPPRPGEAGPQEQPGLFDFLGFTHYWGKSKKGRQTVKRRTAASRIRRFTTAIGQWCRRNRHRPIREQHQKLRQKLQGHYNFYGITGNSTLLRRVKQIVVGVWRKWLGRRGRKGYFGWDKMTALLGRLPLPAPRVVHSVYRSV
jgi:RNA-directed DNA polymerase